MVHTHPNNRISPGQDLVNLRVDYLTLLPRPPNHHRATSGTLNNPDDACAGEFTTVCLRRSSTDFPCDFSVAFPARAEAACLHGCLVRLAGERRIGKRVFRIRNGIYETVASAMLNFRGTSFGTDWMFLSGVYERVDDSVAEDNGWTRRVYFCGFAR